MGSAAVSVQDGEQLLREQASAAHVLNLLGGALGGPVRAFTVWQLAGGLVWSVGVVFAGYGLGSSIHNVDRYLLPITAVVIVVSLVPLAVEALRTRRRTRSWALAGSQNR